ncbi:hypothetical protein G3U99_13435 [Vibrio coralliilyticus OCN008]|uniref:hypothetical protein n=1 Tax=Vibrio coralliilyticus TaxID=190893 RepID=UPI0013F4B87D|nr:hypothetical protein [Vibrio coralliilyticus]QIJ84741.1 hypothetical protein G3U99_10980 [Vibrio coralliilyticus OCN008]QIJ85201.1 hypothetical protein G3U99_13435 [Vibrio coralliilyticus OCN008]
MEAQYASAVDTSGWLVTGKLTVTGESVLSSLPSTVKPRVTLSLFEESRETYQKTVTLGEEGHLETTVQFDAQGRILSERNDRGEVQYQYDVSGRKVLSRDEEGTSLNIFTIRRVR